jgi:hypothetical protein
MPFPREFQVKSHIKWAVTCSEGSLRNRCFGTFRFVSTPTLNSRHLHAASAENKSSRQPNNNTFATCSRGVQHFAIPLQGRIGIDFHDLMGINPISPYSHFRA